MPQGYFCFVLHSHLPYVRKAGRWPHGEEMLHEALAETYLPILNALYDLKADRIQPKLTIGLTPILLEQLADTDVRNHFELYVEERLEGAESDIRRFEAAGEPQMAYLARFYVEFLEGILDSFRDRFRRDVVGAFRGLLEDGNLDILTSAATHAYLPLVERDSTIYGQLKTGIETYRRFFGRAPRGIWVPECAYRPAYYKEDGGRQYKPGIEEFLAELNLHYFFTDTSVIEGGRLVGKVAGDVVGPYGGLPKRILVERYDERLEPTTKTTFRPYYVRSSNVAVYGRDERTGMQVWSAAHGYPGDFWYREFHKKDYQSGLQYWRITDASGDLGAKQPYEPRAAFDRLGQHTSDFTGIVVDRLNGYFREQGQPGIIVSAYDTELFGHWWFEGIEWLKQVLAGIARSETVALTTADEYLTRCPPTEAISIPESSWGAGGGHYTWLNDDTAWMWPLVHNAELRMEQLVQRHPNVGGDLHEVLKQAARELVLLESSDWPFLISTGQAADYASGRFQSHLARFNHCCAIIERGLLHESDRQFLETAQDLDNPFPEIDYRSFRNREGWLAP